MGDLRDVITFQGRTLEEIKREFKDSIKLFGILSAAL